MATTNLEKYIDTREGIADARLLRTGAHIWALIGYYRAVKKDSSQLARDYHLQPDEVEAVLTFYREHKAAIDARLLLNSA